jgi:glycerol-3-phosphate dehydrogenase subunit B
MRLGTLKYDVVVIGAGTAGLTAATRLAQAGASVCVLAKGVGSTHLAPGTVDVAGYTPDRVASPLEGVARLVAQDARHPYGLVGLDAIRESAGWFQGVAAAGPFPGYAYVGGLERNMLLPTAVGALRPSALAPSTMAGGDTVPGLGRVCIVGTAALRDFHARLCASNLTAAGVEARAVEVALDLERADMSALGIARRFDDASWRARFSAKLAPMLREEEHVGLPAMLGLNDPAGAVADLEHRLGRALFEIPTLPPSVPGMRLYEILRTALRAAGGHLVLGGDVISHERDADGEVVSVATRAAGRNMTYVAPWYVLASGGFASGGIELDSHWATHERVLDLPLVGIPGAGLPRFVASYLDEQPIARAGIEVDHELRAAGAPNVLVAGASLPGAVPWREGSGEGIALASGYRAAQVIAANASEWKRQEAII